MTIRTKRQSKADANGIANTDGLYLNQTKAYHGLGVVTPEALSPLEAMRVAGLDWTVSAQDVVINKQVQEGYKGIMRDDTKEVFNIVSDKYAPIQNHEVFEMIEGVSANVKLESAGSFFGGRRIFALLKSDTMGVGNDVVTPYLAVMTSHDSTLKLSCMPTTIRVVCNNMLNMAIKADKSRMYAIKHTTSAEARMKQLQEVLRSFDGQKLQFEDNMKRLSKKRIKSRKSLVNLFAELYLELNPKADITSEAEKQVFNDCLDKWTTIAEVEQMELCEDMNYWLACNAVTNYIQHKDPQRVTEGWEEKRTESNLLGANDLLSASVMRKGLALCK